MPDRRLRILLVEDYPTNQQVVVNHLIKAGCDIDLAENGQEAVEKFKEHGHEYDIILMDVQMPIMDGFEATRIIREIEKERGQKNVPIIAMTAHAVAGYADKCIQRGMDDYISKPLRKSALLNMIAKWTVSEKIASSAETKKKAKGKVISHDTSDTPMDLAEILKDFDNDTTVVMKIIESFLKMSDKQIQLIEDAFCKGDYALLKRTAHSIKGGAANLSANALAHAASRIEKTTYPINKEKWREISSSLKREHKRLSEYFKETMKGVNYKEFSLTQKKEL